MTKSYGSPPRENDSIKTAILVSFQFFFRRSCPYHQRCNSSWSESSTWLFLSSFITTSDKIVLLRIKSTKNDILSSLRLSWGLLFRPRCRCCADTYSCYFRYCVMLWLKSRGSLTFIITIVTVLSRFLKLPSLNNNGLLSFAVLPHSDDHSQILW